ncbi:methionine--tRNA ligase [Butyrivibrio sp. INlla16]|uniref:methionine--tRNA ligase n=1 Tax=Butyrivibrio sp. INlla16 TaxID=1520807 RepID=UPI00087FD677|nr:methionine--tRNA ligase [Butyrivibrio sp. INlla16]SDB24374.1 methionyl-tRNA synthetase [Butyrivibrio sp. INlla16]
MNRNILIGGAWPYANGSLHIGHIAGLLPGDVLARYHRACRDRVYFVSGSDCHGTPVAIRAKSEGKSPREISDHYHEEFVDCFNRLGFSYDCYTKTSDDAHKEFVQEFHRRLYDGDYVYEKETPQAYCECCNTYLADRFVTGSCPVCGEPARGDQCDACGTVLDPEILKEPICAVCKNPVTFRASTHLYIAISKLEKQLRDLVDNEVNWRKNAISFTNRYIDEELRDRALTRDLEWGIPVPKEGYEKKTIYIWAENVLGYLSAAKQVTDREGESFDELFGENAKHYYVHGKDNIPFHTIILPALLLAHGAGYRLPDQIVSSEYLTLEGKKISTSRNYAIWVKNLLDKYDSDSLRYYFLANGPEKKDSDFSWSEYVNNHNGELLGAYGNFINRTLTFITKYFDGVIPEGTSSGDWDDTLKQLYTYTGEQIEKGNFKDAIEGVFEVVRKANKYFDEQEPWKTITSDEAACRNTLYQCVQIIANLAVVLAPFLPFSSDKVCSWLGINTDWEFKVIPSGYRLPEISILFERLDKAVIEEERDKLKDL